MEVLHHIHTRKRIHEKKETYPSRNKQIKFLDNFLMIAALLSPLAYFPQIFKIFFEKTAAGVSLTTFSIFAIFSIPWIFYGVVHKERPIIVMYVLFFLMHLVIIFGIIMYS